MSLTAFGMSLCAKSVNTSMFLFTFLEERLAIDPRLDDGASEDMAQAYEEILSDEEDMGDIGSLDSLLDDGVS